MSNWKCYIILHYAFYVTTTILVIYTYIIKKYLLCWSKFPIGHIDERKCMCLNVNSRFEGNEVENIQAQSLRQFNLQDYNVKNKRTA